MLAAVTALSANQAMHEYLRVKNTWRRLFSTISL